MTLLFLTLLFFKKVWTLDDIHIYEAPELPIAMANAQSPKRVNSLQKSWSLIGNRPGDFRVLLDQFEWLPANYGSSSLEALPLSTHNPLIWKVLPGKLQLSNNLDSNQFKIKMIAGNETGDPLIYSYFNKGENHFPIRQIEGAYSLLKGRFRQFYFARYKDDDLNALTDYSERLRLAPPYFNTGNISQNEHRVGGISLQKDSLRFHWGHSWIQRGWTRTDSLRPFSEHSGYSSLQYQMNNLLFLSGLQYRFHHQAIPDKTEEKIQGQIYTAYNQTLFRNFQLQTSTRLLYPLKNNLPKISRNSLGFIYQDSNRLQWTVNYVPEWYENLSWFHGFHSRISYFQSNLELIRFSHSDDYILKNEANSTLLIQGSQNSNDLKITFGYIRQTHLPSFSEEYFLFCQTTDYSLKNFLLNSNLKLTQHKTPQRTFCFFAKMNGQLLLPKNLVIAVSPYSVPAYTSNSVAIKQIFTLDLSARYPILGHWAVVTISLLNSLNISYHEVLSGNEIGRIAIAQVETTW